MQMTQPEIYLPIRRHRNDRNVNGHLDAKAPENPKKRISLNFAFCSFSLKAPHREWVTDTTVGYVHHSGLQAPLPLGLLLLLLPLGLLVGLVLGVSPYMPIGLVVSPICLLVLITEIGRLLYLSSRCAKRESGNAIAFIRPIAQNSIVVYLGCCRIAAKGD